MATRLYFQSVATPNISPAFGPWGSSGGTTRRVMATSKVASAMTSFASANTLVTSAATMSFMQFISAAIATGTVFSTSHTFTGNMRMQGSANSAVPDACVRVLSSDGATVRATLISPGTPQGTSQGLQAALTNVFLPEPARGGALALETSYTTVAGDRLVVEVGMKAFSALTYTVTASAGDDAASDLPQDETTTTALNPWVEFSNNFLVGAIAAAKRPRSNRAVMRAAQR